MVPRSELGGLVKIRQVFNSSVHEDFRRHGKLFSFDYWVSEQEVMIITCSNRSHLITSNYGAVLLMNLLIKWGYHVLEKENI